MSVTVYASLGFVVVVGDPTKLVLDDDSYFSVKEHSVTWSSYMKRVKKRGA